MRFYYFSISRKKEKIVMIGQVPSFGDVYSKWQAALAYDDWVLPIHLRLEASSYLDWIGPALIRHKQNEILREREVSLPEEIAMDPSKWDISVIHASELVNLAEEEKVETIDVKEHIMDWKPLRLEDGEYKEKIAQRLSYKYPYQEAVDARAKQTDRKSTRLNSSHVA